MCFWLSKRTTKEGTFTTYRKITLKILLRNLLNKERIVYLQSVRSVVFVLILKRALERTRKNQNKVNARLTHKNKLRSGYLTDQQIRALKESLPVCGHGCVFGESILAHDEWTWPIQA